VVSIQVHDDGARSVLPRRNAQSSRPRHSTRSACGVGRSMTRRTIVIQEVVIPSREAKRAPSLPHVANPMPCSASHKRVVICAHGATR
jgi:hypothetical protein